MVTTYGHIAAALGLRSSARMVGWALNAIPVDQRLEIPAHRVVNRLGELSGKMHFETPHVMRERLEAIPFARFTVECQAQLERENGGRGFRRPVRQQLFDSESGVDSDED